VQDRNTDAAGKPLTARSVLASTLLGADPPELPVAHLVAVAGLFGVNPNRARVALSRMVSSGEATTDGAGTYRLAGHLLDRQRRQAESRAGYSGPWSGDWHVVVLTSVGDAAEVRSGRRRALETARLAELRQGVWTRPDNLALERTVAPDAEWFRARPSSDPAVLAAALWDLTGWAARARRLLADIAARPTRGPDDLAPGFVLSAAVLRHLQGDALLPTALVPESWPGAELRTAYDEFDSRYRAVLADWGRRVRA